MPCVACAAFRDDASTLENNGLVMTFWPGWALSQDSSLSGRKRLNTRSHSAKSDRTISTASARASGSRVVTVVPIALNCPCAMPTGMLYSGDASPA